MAKSQPVWFRNLRAMIFSRRGLAIFKGTLAYLIALVLICIRRFDALSPVPQTFSAIFLLVIAGGAGKPVGSTLGALVLGLTGLLVGTANFFFLAKLSPWPIAQAVVWFVMVYFLAFIKALGLQYFGFALLAILMSFNGISSSFQLGQHFSSLYLKEYLKAYLWGAGITTFVSFCIFPISSEKELRRTLVTSLQHIETFGMLINRSFLMIATEEERKLQDELAKTIRADFGMLTQRLGETTLEINWSRWSLEDYQSFIARTRALQLALISTHSSLKSLDTHDDALYKKVFLPKTVAAFNKVRMDIRMTIREIEEAFGAHIEPLDVPKCVWVSYFEVEDSESPTSTVVSETAAPAPAAGSPDPIKVLTTRRMGRSGSFAVTAEAIDRAAALKEVSNRLAAEIEQESGNNGEPSDEKEKDSPDATHSSTSGQASPYVDTIRTPRMKPMNLEEAQKFAQARGPAQIRADWEKFQEIQNDFINDALTGGNLCGVGKKLRVSRPQPSVREMYGEDHIRGKLYGEDNRPKSLLNMQSEIRHRPKPGSSSRNQQEKKSKKRVAKQAPPPGDAEKGFQVGGDTDSSNEDEEPRPASQDYKRDPSLLWASDSDLEGDGQETPEERKSRKEALSANHSLVKVYSLTYAMSQYVDQLSKFHERISQNRPHKRFHVHLFEKLKHPETPATNTGENDLNLKEALAILEGKPYIHQHRPYWMYLHDLKELLKSGNSIYAIKTAAAATIFAMFLWIEDTRQWFLNYSLTGGLLTVVVALAPTLGQSALTFILQIAGSAIGYLVGLAMLEAFRGVGGYTFNPYGIIPILTLYSIPMQYILYEQPKFFALAFLGLNATGVLFATEWIYVEYLHRTNFDSPAYRTAKSLTGLAVGIALCAVFQLLIGRNPARRTLRKSLAHLTYSTLSYSTLLQAYVRAVMPADPRQRPSEAAVARVTKELKRREIKLQAEIISIMPLITFAAAEPSLSKRFSPKPALRIIQANQVILDRLREARSAIGENMVDEMFLEYFVANLSPYRRRAHRLTKNTLAMCAASLATKLPLSYDLPRHQERDLYDFMHDALLISHRFAKTDKGKECIKKGELTRYWFYILGVTSVIPQLAEIEDVCIGLYGHLEDSLL